MSEIKASELKPEKGRPHLVLLGAGASYAGFPHGDAHGRKLPLMNNFVEVVGMELLADQAGIPWKGRNFEDFYSELFDDTSKASIRQQIEKFVFDYFSRLELPDAPTIYDYLLLSLRPKDVVATFNWDPFLQLAFMRNYKAAPMPQFLYLHGNAAIAYRFKPDGTLQIGPALPHLPAPPRNCKRPPLLYPVRKKDYQTDALTHQHWEWMADALGRAFLFTIFGYGAPSSDGDAVRLMKGGWGKVEQRQFEQVEIIDIRNEEELVDLWEPFIHTHHYEVHSSFFESTLATIPRRSVEGMFAMLIGAQWLDANPVPPLGTMSLKELQDWFRPLIDAERDAELGL